MTEETKMTEETNKKLNYIDQLDDNFGSVFVILCLTFIMTTINGYSILYYIFTVDSIMNPDILNDTISIDELYYQSDFYIMAITISLIIMVLNHIYGLLFTRFPRTDHLSIRSKSVQRIVKVYVKIFAAEHLPT